MAPDKYDDLFAKTAPEGSLFANKRAMDPLAEPANIRGRADQERQLATILNGIQEGYLPPTVAIHGPPGTGKTVTTRRVCREFAARHDAVAVEYVNLKECRSIFSAATEIHIELTGETVGAYEGLDGAFEGIWTALADDPTWTVLILDEIDHIAGDTNYDPSDFLYRLLRGEGKRARDIDLSAWLISNELLEVDLRLDSRVESAMSDDQVFFPPYGIDELATVLEPRLHRAFAAGTLPDDVRDYGIREAARRWGDARKAIRMFRRAGETAAERGLEAVKRDCIDANLAGTDREAVQEKLLALPFSHFHVLLAVVSRLDRRAGEIIQPVTTNQVAEAVQQEAIDPAYRLSERRIREVLTDLETMGLVKTWVGSRGRGGRVKQVEAAVEPAWIRDIAPRYLAATDQVDTDALLPE